MVREVLGALSPRDGGVYCDVTIGAGGHAASILEACAGCRVVGIDRDGHALDLAEQRLAAADRRRWSLHRMDFSSIDAALADAGVTACDGILADLGVSSMQLGEADRGFSFQLGGPLDMRMDDRAGWTALDVVRRSSQGELERMLRDNAGERFAGRVARSIHEAARAGGIRDTLDLARVIREALRRTRSGSVDSATRTFLALRMAVNREREELGALLDAVPRLLSPGGVFVCLSYHSVEDGLVKRALRDWAARELGEVLTRKPVPPSGEEVEKNPRSRSARMRAFRRWEP